MKLWIVGKIINHMGAWEFQGVFDSEDLAIAQCKDKTYFIGPEILNQTIPDSSTFWPGAYYPFDK